MGYTLKDYECKKIQEEICPKSKIWGDKKSSATNIDKISVILIDNIIYMPITKLTEKVKDTNIFSFGISFVKRLNLSEIQREYKRNKRLGKYKPIFE